MAGGVLVAPLGVPCAVSGPGGGVAAGRKLVAERRDRRRVDAALAEDLVIRPGHDMAGEWIQSGRSAWVPRSGARPETCAMYLSALAWSIA